MTHLKEPNNKKRKTTTKKKNVTGIEVFAIYLNFYYKRLFHLNRFYWRFIIHF